MKPLIKLFLILSVLSLTNSCNDPSYDPIFPDRGVGGSAGTEAPKMGKVYVEQTSTITATITWSATDDLTPQNELSYDIYLSQQPNFTPDTTTLKTTVLGATKTDLANLETGKTYYILVIATDKNGFKSVEREYRPITIVSENTPVQKLLHVTDTRTDVGLIIANSKESELITIHGAKDAQGYLTSATDVIHSIDSSKSIHYHVNDSSLEVRFIKPDKKYKLTIKNYNSTQATADMVFTEQNADGSEKILSQATKVSVPNNLPIRSISSARSILNYDTNKCFKDNNCDFSKFISVCLMNWAMDMLNQIQGMFCSSLEHSITNITIWLIDFGNATEGKKGKFCKPYDLPEENCSTENDNNFSGLDALSDATTFADCKVDKDFEACLDLVTGKINDIRDNIDGLKKSASCKPAKETPVEECDQKSPVIPQGPKATSNGDPHLYTFDNLAYDFQGAGEFIFTKSTITGNPFEIQVRQKPWKDRTDVAITSAAAINVGGEKVGFYLGQNPMTYINGKSQEIKTSLLLPNGGRISKSNSLYSITFPDGNSLVEVKNNGWGLLVNAYVSGSHYKGKLIGLLGDANGDKQNDLMLRDGTKLGSPVEFNTLHTTYANSWRIKQEESLFDYAAGETTETFTNRNFPRLHSKADRLPANVRAAAEKICRDAGVTDPVALENCILDVALTGEAGFAQDGVGLNGAQAANITPPPAPQFGTAGFGRFSGSVFDAVSKQLVNGTQISVGVNGTPLPSADISQSVNGRYQSSVLPTGSGYSLSFVTSGYITEQMFMQNIADRQTIETEPVNLVPLNLDGKVGTITGRARNALDNQMMSNLTVEARRYINNRQGDPLKVTKTDSNGEFRFDGLNSGNYTLAFFSDKVSANYFTAINLGGQNNFVDAVINPDMGNALYRVILTWNDTSDLDAHLTGPDGQNGRFHIYFNVPGSNNAEQLPYAFLDRDNKEGFGPETISIYKLQTGVYRYSVHDYKNSVSTSSRVLGASGAKVTLYNRNGLVATYSVPNQEGTLWTVFEMDQNGSVIPINSIGYEANQGTVSTIRTKSLRQFNNSVITTDYYPISFQSKKH